jgi:Asp-tRNA(Asn)/Glu-tRNA(Gln) amidotransferase A subunit family amidase
MSKRFDDALVLQAGAAFQAATDWHKARPPVG